MNNDVNNHEQTMNQDQQLHEELLERRQRILELYSKGYTQRQIAQELKIGQATVSRDLQGLEKIAQQQLLGLYKRTYGLVMFKVFNGYDALINKAWSLLEEQKDPKILLIVAALYEKFWEHTKTCDHWASWKSDNRSEIAKLYEDPNIKNFPGMFAIDFITKKDKPKPAPTPQNNFKQP